MNPLPMITIGDSGEGGEPAFRAWIAGPDGAQVCYVDELGPAAEAAAELLRSLVKARLEAP